jgi:hypothetical protein
MDDNVLCLLIPFLIEIVVSKVDVQILLTDSIKENIIYQCLDEGKILPCIEEIIDQ